MDARTKSILTGLFLSKYGKKALIELGFKTSSEAFNVLGYIIGTKPASLKNYRDEFDPLYPNERRGWHRRPIREYCKEVFDKYDIFEFDIIADIVKSFLIQDYEIEKFETQAGLLDHSETVAKRLMTGRAAEEYFKQMHHEIEQFRHHSLIDTTAMACGFDYKLDHETDYYCIEVKGLIEAKGSILLTEKEFYVAGKIASRYCLFIVKNFQKTPSYDLIFDPLNSQLKFKEVKREIIQTSFTTSI